MTNEKPVACKGTTVTNEKPVFSYITYLSIPGPSSDQRAHFKRKLPNRPQGWSFLKELNRAWGFEDGNCGEWVDGEIVDLPGGLPDGFASAVSKFQRGYEVRCTVHVYKDGRKQVEVAPQ